MIIHNPQKDASEAPDRITDFRVVAIQFGPIWPLQCLRDLSDADPSLRHPSSRMIGNRE